MTKTDKPAVEERQAKLALDSAVKTCRELLAKGKSIVQNVREKELLDLQERYSRFEDKTDSEGFIVDSAHRIHRPMPPRSYFHALHNFQMNGRAYGTLWDQGGRGYSYLHTLRGGEITLNTGSPYKPLIAGKNDQRVFYAREKNSAGGYADCAGNKVDAWSLFPLADNRAGRYSNFSCTQTRAQVTLEGSKNQIASSLSVCVPAGKTVEILKLSIKNLSAKKRELDLFFRVDIGLACYPASRLNRGEFFRAEADKKANSLILSNIDITDKNPRTAFVAADVPFAGFELSGERFDGLHCCDLIPTAVVRGSLSSLPATPIGEPPIAGLHFKVSLGASAVKTVFFAIGAFPGPASEVKKEIEQVKKAHFGDKLFSAELARSEKAWDEFAGVFLVKTPDAEFNRYFNVWSTTQIVNAALFQSGGAKFEFRERMQLLTALCTHMPSETKRLLRETIAYQLRDGRAISRFSRFKDDPADEEATMDNTLWMVDAACRYIHETGDLAFLDDNIGFFDPKLQTIDNSKTAKVYEHIMLAVKCLFDYRGRFGLCKVGSLDRNRALTHLTKLGGISAWLSMALIRCAIQLFPYARLKNVKRDVGYLNTILENMYSNLNNYSWNGVHYTYAYDDNGNPIGNKGEKEGGAHLCANIWALLSGTAAKGGHEKEIFALLDELDTPFGYRNLQHPYSVGFSGKGGIPDLVPGTFENGAVDLFGRAFASYAFAEKGMGKKAWQAVKKALPSQTIPDISASNPVQISEFTVGPSHPDFGKNMYDIFNPGIAWFKLAMERVIGVVPTFDGLLLSPSIPPEWDEFTVRRLYRGAWLSIRFHNPDKKESGIKKVTVNGRELARHESGQYLLDSAAFKGAPKNKPVVIDVLMG